MDVSLTRDYTEELGMSKFGAITSAAWELDDRMSPLVIRDEWGCHMSKGDARLLHHPRPLTLREVKRVQLNVCLVVELRALRLIVTLDVVFVMGQFMSSCVCRR